MTDSKRSQKKPERPVLMPVTKLVSRPKVAVINGQLTLLRVLVDRKAA